MVNFRFIDIYAQTFLDVNSSFAGSHLKTPKPQTFNDLLFEAVNGFPKPVDETQDTVLVQNMQENLFAKKSLFSHYDPVLAKYRAGDNV